MIPIEHRALIEARAQATFIGIEHGYQDFYKLPSRRDNWDARMCTIATVLNAPIAGECAYCHGYEFGRTHAPKIAGFDDEAEASTEEK